ALIAPAILVVIKYSRKQRYVLGPGSAFIAVAILLLAACIYAIVASFTTLHEEKSLDMILIVRFSYVLFVVSLIISWVVACIENQAINVNLRNEEAKEQQQLSARFEARLKEQEDAGQ